MSFGGMFVLAVAVVAGMVHVEVPGQNLMLPAGSKKVFGAEPQKHKDLGDWLPGGDVLGFTGKGGEPFALERSVPGVQGALELTAEQKQKIAAAMAETIQSEQVRAAMAMAKLNPDATQAQKEEARKAVAEARGKLRGLVGQILTEAQKKLIADINAAVEQVRREVSESMQGGQAPDKHDEAAVKRWREQVHQRIDAALKKRITEMLNPAQKAAFEQAAAAQAAAENAAVKPKGPDKTKEQDKGKGPDKGKQTDKPKTLEVRK